MSILLIHFSSSLDGFPTENVGKSLNALKREAESLISGNCMARITANEVSEYLESYIQGLLKNACTECTKEISKGQVDKWLMYHL
jgi:hypothetical protein